MACPVRVQERLRGWRCRGLLSGVRPSEDSRVPLTWAVGGYYSWRGGIPSPHASTTSRMVMQWPEWRRERRGWSHRADGDGGDRSRWPDVTAWRSCSSSLRGLRHPFSRVRPTGHIGAGGTVPRGCCRPCRIELHSGGDGLATGVGGAVPGHDSQARSGVDSPLTWAPRNVSALNAPMGAGMEAAGP
jgi:hypothetical protein